MAPSQLATALLLAFELIEPDLRVVADDPLLCLDPQLDRLRNELFVAQCHNRINANGTPSRDIAGEK